MTEYDLARIRKAVCILRDTWLFKDITPPISHNVALACKILWSVVDDATPPPEIPPYFWLGAEAVL